MEILNQVKELELRAGKYDSLKECFENEIPKINKMISEVENKLSDIKLVLKNINPLLALENAPRTKRTSIKPILERIYNDMMINDEDVSTEDIEVKYNAGGSKGWISSKLRRLPGVHTRNEGRRIVFYYFKGTGNKDKVEIDKDTTIPKKFSHMG